MGWVGKVEGVHARWVSPPLLQHWGCPLPGHAVIHNPMLSCWDVCLATEPELSQNLPAAPSFISQSTEARFQSRSPPPTRAAFNVFSLSKTVVSFNPSSVHIHDVYCAVWTLPRSIALSLLHQDSLQVQNVSNCTHTKTLDQAFCFPHRFMTLLSSPIFHFRLYFIATGWKTLCCRQQEMHYHFHLKKWNLQRRKWISWGKHHLWMLVSVVVLFNMKSFMSTIHLLKVYFIFYVVICKFTQFILRQDLFSCCLGRMCMVFFQVVKKDAVLLLNMHC